ncbi:MAG: DNA polymerase III subunit epsilon [SAR86 cluster bacterium]|uniref:DNA-directed DNA polymerase n=1 Tax=SAR86 cluster bacterium TaxID=2030880 RepID=A0A2A5CFI5_9GAMM|nr:3'-5' exonuclease [Gammaproteobacteria bacterium AH-315-E17]PCJ42637.1 MAG: DNA polymerase III subunit epsilon [SAR86 cluster bacterium]
MKTFAVIDFETTGLSPDHGDRVTEVGVVILSNGKIVDRYQSLINPLRPIPDFVQSLTGITNVMVRSAPDAASVMQALYDFVGDTPFVAHNASFDRKFLDAEYARAGLKRQADMVCSLLLARRMYPNMPNHKLGTLVRLLSLPSKGTYHRALADAEMTAHLLARIISDMETQHGLELVTHKVLSELQGVSKNNFASAIKRY